MSSEDVFGVPLKIKNGDYVGIANFLDPRVSKLSLLIKSHLVFLTENRIFPQFIPFGNLFYLVAKKFESQVV